MALIPQRYPTQLVLILRSKQLTFARKKIKLHIWDTAGQDEFDYLTTSFYRNAMGILVVYDKTKISSFQNLPNWLQKIKTHANHSVETIILCNKSDAEEEEVQVSNDLADDFSR